MKRIFSGKYYNETMRQLRMLGLIMLAISVIITGLNIFMSYNTWQNLKEAHPAAYLTYNPYSGVSGMFPTLSILMFVGGFLLPMNAFGFLHRRSASDFYHAIPLKRTAVFTTNVIACISWAALIILATVATGILGCLVTGMIFPYANLIYCIPAYFIGTLLMVAIVTLAMTLTGTKFSTFMVTMIILFLPRFILAIINVGTLEFTEILSLRSLSFIFDASYNILVGSMLSGMFGGYPFTSMTVNSIFMSTWAYLYSGVLTLIYFAAAGMIFKLRKSETAGSSAPNRVLQHVYRCLVTLPFVILAVMLIVLGVDSYALSSIIIMFVISLFVYFLYELITTKSAKRMLTCAPLYLAVVAVAALILVGTRAAVSVEAGRRIDMSSVKSISETTMWASDDGLPYSAYLTESVSFTNEQMIEIGVNALNNTVDIMQGKSDEYANLQMTNYSTSMTRTWLKFKLKNGSEMVRLCYINVNDYSKFCELQEATPEYREALYATPKDNEISRISILGAELGDNAKNEDLRRIWSVYKDEYGKLSYDQLSELMLRRDGSSITIEGAIGGTGFYSYYPLSVEYTPEAFNEILTLANSSRDWYSVSEELKTTKTEVENKDTFYSLELDLYFYGSAAAELNTNELHMNFDRWSMSYDTLPEMYAEYAVPSVEVNIEGIDQNRPVEWFMEFADFVSAHGRLSEANDPGFMSMALNYHVENPETGWFGNALGVYITIDPEYYDELRALIEKGDGFISTTTYPDTMEQEAME